MGSVDLKAEGFTHRTKNLENKFFVFFLMKRVQEWRNMSWRREIEPIDDVTTLPRTPWACTIKLFYSRN